LYATGLGWCIHGWRTTPQFRLDSRGPGRLHSDGIADGVLPAPRNGSQHDQFSGGQRYRHRFRLDLMRMTALCGLVPGELRMPKQSSNPRSPGAGERVSPAASPAPGSATPRRRAFRSSERKWRQEFRACGKRHIGGTLLAAGLVAAEEPPAPASKPAVYVMLRTKTRGPDNTVSTKHSQEATACT